MTEFGDISLPLSKTTSKENHALLPEQAEKMSLDIKTLSHLRQYAINNGFTFVLTGGYGVDALNGGSISRFHSDMDGVLFIPEAISTDKIQSDIWRYLEQEETNWQLHTNDGWFLEYREDDEEKEWEMKRRIELDIFEPDQKRNIITKKLIDFEGNSHEFEVISVAGLTVAKILSVTRLAAMSPEEREKEGFREMKGSDVQDFLRLLYHDDFNRDEVMRELAFYNQDISEGKLDEEAANIKAEEQWQDTLRIISGK